MKRATEFEKRLEKEKKEKCEGKHKKETRKKRMKVNVIEKK